MDEKDGIPEYFRGKHVFVTGAFGFLGKLLVEKLLRSCSGLAKLYVLHRPKRGKSVQERLKKIDSGLLFARIKETNPDIIKEKLVVLEGDITQERLGLSEQVYNELVQNVNVIVHLAASIKFNDPLSFAIRVNVLGTKNVMELATKINSLDSFVHVSTAYAHCNRLDIDEVYYKPKIKWDKLVEIMEKTDTATFEMLSPKILDGFPNTYVFSKGLAEDLVWDYRKLVPIVIVRPSIVISCWQEPIPGWIDNLYGPAGFIFGAAKGVIRVMYADSEAYAAYIPADTATKATVAAIWYRHKHRETNDEDHIYNINHVQSKSNKNILDDCMKHLAKYPLRWSLWKIDVQQTKSYPMFIFLFYIKHLIPALLVDSLLIVLRQKPILIKVQKKFYTGMNLISWFIMRMWDFKIDNFARLDTVIPAKDRQDFAPNLHSLEPQEYTTSALVFGRDNILKDVQGEPHEFWIRAKMLDILDKIVSVAQICFVGWLGLLLARAFNLKLPQFFV